MPDAPELWVDAGIADAQTLAAALAEPSLCPVLGSESQRDDALLQRFRDHPGLILSLDFFADGFRGPQPFLDEPDLWPQGDRHDAGQGRLRRRSRISRGSRRSRRRPETAPSSPPAACATRPIIRALSSLGIAAALVATSLHDGTLTARQLASLGN